MHLTQKIGLVGIVFVFLISTLLYFSGYFTPFLFVSIIPFLMLILIGYSITNSKKKKLDN